MNRPTEPSPFESLPPNSLPPNSEIREVGRDRLPVVQELNGRIFGQQQVIGRWDHPDLVILLAYRRGEPAGFKVGYADAEDPDLFYSAKGGVLSAHRRQGLGRALLHAMIARVRGRGYERFAFHTLPNLHPGMAVLALREQFQVTDARYHPEYEDYILRFECDLTSTD